MVIQRYHRSHPLSLGGRNWAVQRDLSPPLFGARPGWRADATANLQARINTMLVSLKGTGLARLFSVKQEFPTEWFAFLNTAAGGDQVLSLNLTRDRFPYFAAVAPTLKLKNLEILADTTSASSNGINVAPARRLPQLSTASSEPRRYRS